MALSVCIIGDELESCLCAVALGQLGINVTLLRRSTDWLGGLSTRGGLSYMDITPELLSPLFHHFLKAAGWKRVALHPDQANLTLYRWLNEAGVNIVSGVSHWEPVTDTAGQLNTLSTNKGSYQADWWIDSTPDAQLARQLGVPYLAGLGGLCGTHSRVNSLGVSPVFRVNNLTREQFILAEQNFREAAATQRLLQELFPFYSEAYIAELLKRPVYSPEDSDYIDLLSPAIGAAYHQWRYGRELPYDQAPFWIDGFNIARWQEGSLGFNGLIAYEPDWSTQVALSTEQLPVPERYKEEVKAVEQFLREFCDNATLRVTPPKSLYVRQTLQIQARKNLTALDLLSGGVAEQESVGSFSYWIDLRGLHPWLAYPEFHPLPKPQFNTSLLPNFPRQNPAWDNLIVLGRAAGYSPLSQGACRIVQYNCLIAEALAQALYLSEQSRCHPLELPADRIRAGMKTMVVRSGEPLPPLCGKSTLTSQPELEASWLIQGDRTITAALQDLTPEDSLHGAVWKAPHRLPERLTR